MPLLAAVGNEGADRFWQGRNMFKNLSISRKLFFGFGAVVVIGALVGSYAIFQLARVNSHLHNFDIDIMPSVKAVATLRYRMAKSRRTDIWQVALASVEDRQKNRTVAQTVQQSIEEAQKDYEAQISTPGEREIFDHYMQAWNDYVTAREKGIAMADAGNREDAIKYSHDQLVKVFDKAGEYLDQLVEFNMNNGKREASEGGAAFRSARIWIIASIIGAAMIGFAIAIFIARLVTRPVTRTVNVLEAVAKGDYSQTVAVESKDELGRMGLALNTTISAIKSSIEQVREAGEREQKQAAELRAKVDSILDVVNAAAGGDLTKDVTVSGSDAIGQLGEGLAQFFSDLRGSIGGISQNAGSLASSSEELTAVSQQMSATAEETSAQAGVVSAAAEQVSKNVQTVATASEEMSASIKEISKNAADAARIATTAVKTAENTNATIAKLGESSRDIGEVVKLITTIAQQTNLLALNATIEAARAGEAGKGFAVVADEVKELAKQTTKATEEIGAKITTIQADTDNAVAAIKEIGGVITQINDISNTIASAVEEQTATTNEMGRNIAEAAKGSTEIAQNITGVASAAQSTSGGATQTQSAASELAKMAGELQTLVGRFKITSSHPAAPRPAQATCDISRKAA